MKEVLTSKLIRDIGFKIIKLLNAIIKKKIAKVDKLIRNNFVKKATKEPYVSNVIYIMKEVMVGISNLVNMIVNHVIINHI